MSEWAGQLEGACPGAGSGGESASGESVRDEP